MKNYYHILGLNMNAEADEIKRVYRQLAKRYHPDVNQNNEIAASKFKEVNEAYDVLGDASRKMQYDADLTAEFNKANTLQFYGKNYNQQSFQQTGTSPYRGQNYYQPQYENEKDEYRKKFSQSANYNSAYQQGYSQACQMAEGAQKIGYTKGYGKGYADAQNKYSEIIRSLQMQIDEQLAKNKDIDAMLEDYHNNAMQEAQIIIKEYQKNYSMERESFISELQKKAKAEIEKLSRESALRFQSYEDKYEELKKEAEQEKQNIKARETQLKDLNNKLMGQIKALNIQLDEQYKAVSMLEAQRGTADDRLRKAEEEMVIMRSTIAGWEEYGKTLDYAENILSEKTNWELKEKNDKKNAKNTLYGPLGTYIWALDEEIKENYIKLVKRYQKKAETDPKAKEKLNQLNSAYKVLSDSATRAMYNESIGYDQKRLDEERNLLAKYEERMIHYETQKAEQEFWTYVEELMYNAQTGDAESQNVLGEMYYYGDELEKDLSQAVYWFKEAAKQRHVEAMYNLGMCFLNGEGVPFDEAKGKGFIKQAEKLKGEKKAGAVINDSSETKQKHKTENVEVITADRV